MRLKNLLNWIDNRNRWWFQYGPPFGWKNYYGYSRKPWEYPHDLWLQLKWFYQRGKRGYSDRDVWSFDWYLCDFLGNALRDLAAQVHGVPARDVRLVPPDDFNDLWTLSIEEWQFTLKYLAETFDLGKKILNYSIPPERMDEAFKRFNHGMRMFHEYFFNLWD